MSFDPPKSRTEAILQNMLGANNVLEPPKSRVEVLLIAILNAGGGSGITPEQLEEAIASYLEKHPIDVPTDVVLYTEQSLTPEQQAQVLDNIHAMSADTAIPDAVTEQTVAGWGFSKNTGTYSKPNGGIPKNDLAADVKASLSKADSALQQHQSLKEYATQAWVSNKGYLTLADLPVYNGGVS